MTRYAVVGIDGSAGSRVAAHWAAGEAAARGLALRMVTVTPARPSHILSGATSAQRGTPVPSPAEREAGRIARAHPDLDLAARDLPGEPSQVLADIGQGAELLAVGTRGTGGFDELRLGSVALGVAGLAMCSVVLVPPDSAQRRGHEVVVGLDAGHPDEGALDVAFEEAGLRGARLRVVHAWDVPATDHGATSQVPEEDRAEWEDQEAQLLDDALRGRREKHPGVSVLPDVRPCGAAEALVRASAGAAVLVVGRGPRTTGYLGGVAHAVAHHTRCPLLLTRRH